MSTFEEILASQHMWHIEDKIDAHLKALYECDETPEAFLKLLLTALEAREAMRECSERIEQDKEERNAWDY